MSVTTTGGRGLDAFRANPRTTIDQSGRFDLDAWHAMDQRDNALIADDVIHGALSNKFTYSFNLGGTAVAGVSVIGARHLAAAYGGIKHRIIASCEKKGPTHFFRSYPYEGTPMSANVMTLHEMADDPDYYTVVIEITDVKRGLSIQVEKTEMRMEKRRDGTHYERPHYQIIAQSKAFRNGILDILPQDFVIRFKEECLKLSKNDDLTTDVIEEKRRAILTYATSKGISIERLALGKLGLDQINGLSAAAKATFEGDANAFPAALRAVGLMAEPVEEKSEERSSKTAAAPPPKSEPKRDTPERQNPPRVTHEQQDEANFVRTETREAVREEVRGPPEQDERAPGAASADEPSPTSRRRIRAQPTGSLLGGDGFGSGE